MWHRTTSTTRVTTPFLSAVVASTVVVSALVFGGTGIASARADHTGTPSSTDTSEPASLDDSIELNESSITGGTMSMQLPFTDITLTAAQGTFREQGADTPAVTHHTDLVPAGAEAELVSATSPRAGTLTKLEVTGLKPQREYGAHVHAEPCGSDPAAAGPRFQYRQDPDQPSTDPAYANPDNEIWLDFTTDTAGAGSATSRVDWTIPDDRKPASLVLYEHHTRTAPGEAGVAGARLACLDVAF